MPASGGWETSGGWATTDAAPTPALPAFCSGAAARARLRHAGGAAAPAPRTTHRDAACGPAQHPTAQDGASWEQLEAARPLPFSRACAPPPRPAAHTVLDPTPCLMPLFANPLDRHTTSLRLRFHRPVSPRMPLPHPNPRVFLACTPPTQRARPVPCTHSPPRSRLLARRPTAARAPPKRCFHVPLNCAHNLPLAPLTVNRSLTGSGRGRLTRAVHSAVWCNLCCKTINATAPVVAAHAGR